MDRGRLEPDARRRADRELYLRIVVKAKKRAALGLWTWLVMETSLSDPLKQAAIKAQVKVVK